MAKYDSSKLNGKAYTKNIPKGKTFKLPITTHIIANAINHEKNVVCIIVNLLAIIYTAVANIKDHTPHKAPLIGSEGNTSPSA